jgi:hypothetical protein
MTRAVEGPLGRSDLVFLLNEVLIAGDMILEITEGSDIWAGFTCREAEAMACIFSAAGRGDVYDFIIAQHSRDDEPDELEFHQRMAE